MTITEIGAPDVLADCRRNLGLPAESTQPLDDAFLGAILRHCAGIYCPCSRATLRAVTVDSLQHLSESPLTERIEAAIESLTVNGDLLELADVITDDPAVKGTWVFAAPPSFVVRRSGSMFLIGVVRDLTAFLPQSFASRIVYEGFGRLIRPEQGEDLRGELRDQGLLELSEPAWLRAPREEAPEKVIADTRQRLAAQPSGGTIEGLQVLDGARPATYYAGRWAPAARLNGMFVGRRPQDYGAPIWCVVSLDNGNVSKLLDLPPKKFRWRACDFAWHFQMAIDATNRVPQRYRRQRTDEGTDFHFFSPIPQWAERRLMIFGHLIPREHSLFSYRLPPAEADIEEQFLRNRLWLTPTEDSG